VGTLARWLIASEKNNNSIFLMFAVFESRGIHLIHAAELVQAPLRVSSLNSTDAFVLDAVTCIFVFVGSKCALPVSQRTLFARDCCQLPAATCITSLTSGRTACLQRCLSTALMLLTPN
jgi:hypothetical protein